MTDGLSHTIYAGEKIAGAQDLGWMSGTRATLRNAGSPPGNGLQNAAKAAASDLWVGGFESYHLDVSNYLFGDGRSDSLSNSIDITVLQQLANRADGKLLKNDPTRDR